MWAARAALACALLVACGEEQSVPATDILVSVNSDLDLDTQLSRVEVELRDFEGQGPVVETRSFAVTSAESPRENQVHMPFSFGIVRGTQDRFRLTVRGFAPGGRSGRPVLQQTLISSFRRQQTLLLKLFLGRACFEQLCESEGVEATCYPETEGEIAAGTCGPIPERTSLDVLPMDADPHAWTLGGDAQSAGDARSAGDASFEAGPVMEGGMDAGPDAGPDAAPDATPQDAGPDAMPEAAPPPPMPRSLTVAIANDQDDVTWVTEADLVAPFTVRTTERFHYHDRSANGRHLEVGNDEADELIGLRFTLPLTRGSLVQSAKLTLQRFPVVDPAYASGASAEDESVRVQVFDSPEVPAFVNGQEISPIDRGSIWSTAVSGYRAGALGQDTESPELQQLVQHVLDQPAWQSGASVTFVLGVDTIADGHYADFTDSSANGGANAPKLTLTHLPPP